MAITAVGSGPVGPGASPGCWGCGDRAAQASLVRLGEHPEVGVCFRCITVLAHRGRDMQRRARAAPRGWPWWRRVRYWALFGR